MKKRKITVNIDSTLKYLQLWNGIFNLTDKGLQVLSAFIDVQGTTSETNLCSVKNKKEVLQYIDNDILRERYITLINALIKYKTDIYNI